MTENTITPAETVELPVLASADADEVTLGRQNGNDSDKSMYLEGM